MYRTLAVLLLTSVLYACSSTPKVEPLFPEKWDEIDAYIKDSWPKYSEKKPEFPAPYTYALNPGTLYYWDMYFINEGLLRHGRLDMVRNNLNCMIYQIEKLGFIPNASRWGEDRSQTPVFALAVGRYWDCNPIIDTVWLRRAHRAVLTEYRFWTNTGDSLIEDHRTVVDGLQRYGQHADTAALLRFYDRVLAARFKISKDAPVEEKLRVAGHRLAEAECMDFTPRFEGRCCDYIPVDLNCFLSYYEINLARFERILGISDGEAWEKAADRRAELIDRYCWNEERGLYLDYDFVNKRHSPVASTAGLMPMHVGFAADDKARRIRDRLSLFGSEGGLVVCEPSEQTIHYQWGDDAVWAPVQMLAMDAMKRYGFDREAFNIAMRWLNTTTKNYVHPHPNTYPPFKYGDGKRHPGRLYEKYTRTGDINDAEYPCSEMLGWTAATFVAALETVRKDR